MIKRNKIPTLIGIVILLVGTFAGVFFLKTTQIFKIGADATSMPKDVRVSNLSASTATISWITEGQTSNFITYGETSNLNTVINESENNQKYLTHSVTVTGLNPSTTYFYKINSEGVNYDNNGVPWQLTTGPVVTGNQVNIPISGSVITASGQPSARTLVYITINGYVLSTITSSAGTFVLQLGPTLTPNLSSYAAIDPAQTLLEISVKAEGGATSTAKIFPQSANPIPTLVLGQDQDYRNLPANESGDNPSADLSLPESSTSESKFNITGETPPAASTTVILESLDPGETITSSKPQFFGKGPGGEPITIVVHSQQVVTGNVTIPSGGSWSWSPTTPLEEGPHSITISWIDASGITRSLTRNFVVQAGEAPAFVASPSGSTPTPTPTVTPIPSATPKATLVATPTPKAIAATPLSTPSAETLPITGSLTATLLFFMMGVAIIVFSAFVWKTAEK